MQHTDCQACALKQYGGFRMLQVHTNTGCITALTKLHRHKVAIHVLTKALCLSCPAQR